jgi:hypothetical protein
LDIIHYLSTEFHEHLPSGSSYYWGKESHFGVIDATFSVINSIQNFIQIHQSVKTLSGGFFAPTPEVSTSAILEWLKVRN